MRIASLSTGQSRRDSTSEDHVELFVLPRELHLELAAQLEQLYRRRLDPAESGGRS